MRKYNIVIIVSDALRAQNLPMYGYKLDTAPNLKKIASMGVIFKNAYATVDQTDPSFTTILSGRYPIVHGITKHGPDLTRNDIETFYKTGTLLLSEILVEEGYQTIALDWLGRWHKKGYILYGSASQLKSKCIRSSKINSLMTKILAKTRSWKSYELLYKLFSKIGYCNDKQATCVFDAVKRIMDKNDKPFFLMIHLWDTHTPFDSIPSFLVREFFNGECSETVHEMASRIPNPRWREIVLRYHLKGIKCIDEIEPRYNASIKFVDKYVGDFINYLEDKKLLDDTIIVITGDHGENLVRNGMFIGHGGLFQRVIKIPLIMFGPHIPSGKIVDEYVQHVDIFPTILDLIGYDKLKGYYIDGNSLLETIETGRPPREYVFSISSTAPRRYALIKGKYKLVYSPSLKDAMDKYGGIWFQDVIELYDLDRDTDDRINLAGDLVDIVNDMKEELEYIVKKLYRIRIKLILTNKIRRRRI